MKINHKLLVIYIADSFQVLASHAFLPIFALFVEELGGNIVWASSVFSVGTLSILAGSFAVYKWGDRVQNHLLLFQVGMFFKAIFWFSYMFVGNVYILLLVRIFTGLADSVRLPGFNSYAAEHLDKGNHVKDYSFWNILSHFSSASGAFLGGLVVFYFGFDLLFALMGCLVLFGFFLSLGIERS